MAAETEHQLDSNKFESSNQQRNLATMQRKSIALHRAKHVILYCWEHVQQKLESSIVIAVRTTNGKAHTYISAHIVRMLNWSTASGISRYAINTGNYPWTKCHTRSPEIYVWNTRTSISRSRMRIFCRNPDNTTHKFQWADSHWLKQNQWHNDLSLRRTSLRKLHKRPNSSKARRGTNGRLKGAEKKSVCFVDRISGTQINCSKTKQNSSDVKP